MNTPPRPSLLRQSSTSALTKSKDGKPGTPRKAFNRQSLAATNNLDKPRHSNAEHFQGTQELPPCIYIWFYHLFSVCLSVLSYLFWFI
jgi:hypothetical protein